MTYVKTTWKDRLVERAKTFIFSENSDGSTTLQDAPGEVTEEGTPLNALNLNHMEQGIYDAHSRVDSLEDVVNFAPKIKNLNTATYYSRMGAYKKIGKMVFFYFSFQINQVGSDSNKSDVVEIEFPFTINNSILTFFPNIPHLSTYYFRVTGGKFQCLKSGVSGEQLKISEIGNGTYFAANGILLIN